VATRQPTNDFLLRDVTEEDLPTLFEHQLDPDATRMAAFPARDWNAFTEHWARVLGDETVTKKTIVFDGKVAGNVLSWNHAGKPHVGYWIGRRYWGKGIATQALSALLDHVQERPMYARVAKHNIASIRVLEKCGFAVSGEDLAHVGGDAIDEFVMELQEGPRRT
jgi:RimJ/RimL family protein N-acetyltransferase